MSMYAPKVEHAEHIAGITHPGDTHHIPEKDYFVVFRVDSGHYALPLPNVDRALRMSTVTPVPEFPDWMPGAIDLHGAVIPVVDIGMRFGQPRREIILEARLLIVRAGGQNLALIVDHVSDVLELPIQGVELPPDIQRDLHLLDAVLRWEGQLILVLNAEHLLDLMPNSLNLEMLSELFMAVGDSEQTGISLSTADDLTLIKGIGPVYAERLNAGGIQTFQDLGNRSPDAIAVLVSLSADQVSKIADWQAQALAQKETKLP